MFAFIGVDDTDSNKEKVGGTGKGTGKVARKIAEVLLEEGYRVMWVLRHQMLRSGEISAPGNNSSKSITIIVNSREGAERALGIAADIVRELAAPDSNAGLALLVGMPPYEALCLAHRIRVELVSTDEVLRIAGACGVRAIPLLGDGSGVIGAFAAAVLASTGNDGRVLDIPGKRFREIRNRFVLVRELLEQGIAEVLSLDGVRLSDDEEVFVDRVKPVLRKFRPVLYVERAGPVWRAAKVE